MRKRRVERGEEKNEGETGKGKEEEESGVRGWSEEETGGNGDNENEKRRYRNEQWMNKYRR